MKTGLLKTKSIMEALATSIAGKIQENSVKSITTNITKKKKKKRSLWTTRKTRLGKKKRQQRLYVKMPLTSSLGPETAGDKPQE